MKKFRKCLALVCVSGMLFAGPAFGCNPFQTAYDRVNESPEAIAMGERLADLGLVWAELQLGNLEDELYGDDD